MKSKSGLSGCINENKLSCRKFVIRHLRIFVSDGRINGRKEIRRSRIKSGMTSNFMGFTLIELLVVVLIIGILAAVALPQYQKAVEKSRMTEAVTLVRAIANANQVFYMANGRYAAVNEIELLDIEVPGVIDATHSPGRIKTKYFIYSPGGTGESAARLAVAQRLRTGNQTSVDVYFISILAVEPYRVRCTVYNNQNATAVQRKLCQQLDDTGSL